MLIGDFNASGYSDNNRADTISRILNDLMQFYELHQFNGVRNANGRLYDLWIAHLLMQCEVEHELQPIVREDAHHPSLCVFLDLRRNSEINFQCNLKNKAYNFARADLVGLYRAILETEWSFIDNNCTDVNNACDLYYCKIYELLDGHVPTFKHKSLYGKYS